MADSFGRVAGLAVNRLDGRGEEEFQLEHTARRGHVFVRGDAADGRLMHADRIGHGLEVQRPQEFDAEGEKGVLLADDLGRYLQDGLSHL